MNKKIKGDQMQREKKVKRLKTHHVRSGPLSTPISVDYFQVEEEESEKIEPGECFAQFQEISNKLRHIFQAILVAKKKRKTDNLQSFAADVCILIMKLKKLNRLDKHKSKKSRDAVNEGKQKVDNLNLQYQNLLYEVTHLQKEVTKCLEFRSQDEEIELIPVEEFYEEAPLSISRPEKTKNDTHEMTMSRLEWELEQRKRLSVKLKEAEVTKEECKNNIRKLKECLQNIQPLLQSILESTEPLQNKLGMPLQITRLKHKVSKFLPKPLYVLYIEISAYKEVCDKNINVTVEGNVDSAKVFDMKVDDIVEDSGESDQEENFNSKRHRHTVSVRPEETDKDILSKHPLTVNVNMQFKGSSLVIELSYLYYLNIVTVHVRNLVMQQSHSALALTSGLLNPQTLLKCLLSEDDEGKMSPNPTSNYLLRKIKYEDTPFSNDVSGWPYAWAQQMSGLHFMSASENSTSSQKMTGKMRASYIENVMTAIRSRINVRISLAEQIARLEYGMKMPSDIGHLYPPNVTSQLKLWTMAKWKDVSNHPKCDELLELGLLRKDSMIFKAIIERGSAVLTAVVIIPLEYPQRSPLFLLFLMWKVASTSATNSSLRELEEEINVVCTQSLPDEFNEMLTRQVYHLLCCFDIFLETEHSVESLVGPCEFLQEKVVARNFRGRSHSRPYRYLSSKGIFTH